MKVAIITNIVTVYREGFYDRLFSNKDFVVTVYCNDHIKGTNLKSIHERYGDRVKIVPHIGLKNEKIGFQFLPITEIIRSHDVIFLDGNPRTLSNLLIGFIALFLRNTKVVMWTMAHSYGANKITENLRLKWTSIYKNIFVYTDKEVATLRNRGFKKQNIIGMNNGLDQRKIDGQIAIWNGSSIDNWKKERNLESNFILLSVARLVPKNKFQLMIKALPLLVQSIPEVKWIIIGDGEEKISLIELAKKLDVEKYIVFAGSIFEEEELAPYFLSSKIFIHPSSVGLSIMHAFGYGLPIIVDGVEGMHGPEYGAFRNNETGKNYDRNDFEDLANKIVEIAKQPLLLEEMKKKVLTIAREEYNVDIMVNRFIDMAKVAN